MDTEDNIGAPQIDELITLIKKLYGFDFTHYSKASFKRRMMRVINLKQMDFWELKHRLINDAGFFQYFLEEITVNVTEMFRDPSFYRALRTDVFPYLNTYQQIKIWSAGCSTGEEAYSLSILMNEMSLKEKSLIYGTDVNTEVLKQARMGIYSLRKIKSYAENYTQTALPGSLTDHFTVMYDAAAIHSELKLNTLFNVHNLISDKVFNEFQMICCRNVFIYFDIELQENILHTFYNSLCNFGFICLGSKETIRSEFFRKRLKIINSKENIYQKVG